MHEQEIYDGDFVKMLVYDGWNDSVGFYVTYQVLWSNFDFGWRGYTKLMIPEKYAGVKLNGHIILI